jgi:hypothetical protein
LDCYELLAVGAGLNDSLNRLLDDLVRRLDVLELILLGGCLIQEDLLTTLDLDIGGLALELHNWGRSSDRRRSLLDYLHLRDDLLGDEVLLLDDVRWLQTVVLNDCWRRNSICLHSLRDRYLLSALKCLGKYFFM